MIQIDSIQYQTAMNFQKNLLYTNKFIVKLVGMMKQFPQIINWSEDGTQLCIYNVQLFTSQVHPLYFTSSNYKSFLRQLNMYNFSKMTKRPNSITFKHPAFSKGQEHLFDTIKRRKQNAKPLEPHPAHSSHSLDHTSKKTFTDNQNSSATIEQTLRQSLREVKQALKGRASDAIAKIQSHIDKLLASYRQKVQEKPCEPFQDYLSMCKLESYARQYREVFTESDFEYNGESNILNGH